MIEQTEIEIIRNRLYDTQTVFSTLQTNSFIVVRKSINKYSCITPFVTDNLQGSGLSSNFDVSISRMRRIQNLFEHVKPISSYKVSIDNIQFNCLENFPENIIPTDIDAGWIHFNYRMTKSEEGDSVIEIDERMIIQQINDDEIDIEESPYELTFEQLTKVNFKVRDLKVFPVIFNNGFIVAIVSESKVTVYVTLNNVEKMYCGSTSQNELNKLIDNIFPIFPYFNCNVNNRCANIFLQNKDVPELRSFFKRSKLRKALVRFQYFFNKPNICTCRIIGRA
jgi:hypothetical protein